MADATALQEISLDEIIPDVRNPNLGTPEGEQAIFDSVEINGAGRSIVVTNDNHTIGGAKTLKAAKATGRVRRAVVVPVSGDTLVVVKRTDIESGTPEAVRLGVADNRTSELSYAPDAEVLAELLVGLQDDGGLLGSGFDEGMLTELLQQVGTETPEAPAPKIDEAEALREKWGVERGQLWQVGRHRLLCGDAMREEDVVRVMGGMEPTLIFADPPWGYNVVNPDLPVGVDAVSALTRGRVGVNGIVYANTYMPIKGDETTETAVTAFVLLYRLYPSASHVWWGANFYASALPDSERWLIWDKENDFNQFADAELAWTNQKGAIRIFRHLWAGMVKASEQGHRRQHPTQKPIALAVWCLRPTPL